MEEINETMEFIARIMKGITNPSMSRAEKIEMATNWAQAAFLIAKKWNTTPWEVIRIAEEREDDAPMFEPTEMKSDEERIFWDYVNECNQFEHIEGE